MVLLNYCTLCELGRLLHYIIREGVVLSSADQNTQVLLLPSVSTGTVSVLTESVEWTQRLQEDPELWDLGANLCLLGAFGNWF